MKRRCAVLALAIAMSAVMVGCQQRELKIGVVAPFSGDASGWGTLVRNGVTLAMDEWNAMGGVLGMKVVPVFGDSQADPSVAVSVAGTLIGKDKVHYMIGEVFSMITIPLSDATNKSKVILVAPLSTNEALTVDQSGSTKPYVFRACFTDPFQAGAGASFAVKNLKARKAFVLSDPGDIYSRGLADVFAESFTTLGGTVVGKGSYSASDLDFRKTLDSVRNAKADVVYVPAFWPRVVNAITDQARKTGVKTLFLGGDAWDSPEIDLHAADGSYFTNHYWAGEQRPEVQSFENAYNQKFATTGSPDILAGMSYDAANLLLQAVKTAGRDDVDRVKAALESLSYTGVGGKLTIDNKHNAVKSAAIIHITGGKMVFDSLVAP